MSEDSTLVNRTLKGDREAFRQLVTRYRNAVYGLAISYVKDFDAAEDLAQEAFIRSYYRLADLKDPSRFGGWVRTITANLCRVELRRQSVDGDFLEMDPDSLPTPSARADEVGERDENYDRVFEALGTLPDGERQVVSLFYLEGKQIEAVCRFLGLSESAVKVRLHRARKRLRKEMMGMTEKTLSKRKLKPAFADEIGIKTFGDLAKLTDEELRSLTGPLRGDFRSLAYALAADDGESAIVRERMLDVLPELDRERLLMHMEFYEKYFSPLDEFRGRVLGAARSLQMDGTIRRAPREKLPGGVVDLKSFRDLAVLSDREMQWLLREVESKDLVIALRGDAKTLGSVRARIWTNVSERVRRMIELEITHCKPSVAEIREMQRTILKTARGLQIRGLIRRGSSPATASKVDVRTFFDLGMLTDREAQYVLRETESTTLATAVRGREKGISAVRSLFMSNLSERVRKMIEDQQRSTKATAAEIHDARAEMVAITRQLQILERIRPAPRKPAKARFERAMVKAANSQIDGAVHGSRWSPREYRDLVGLLALENQDKGIAEAADRYNGLQDPVFQNGLRLLRKKVDVDELALQLQRVAAEELKRMEKEYRRVITGMVGVAAGEDARTVVDRMGRI